MQRPPPSPDNRGPALPLTQGAIEVRPGPPNQDDARTVPRVPLGDESAIEIGSSMFMGEEGAPDDGAATLVGQMISGRYRVDALLGRGGLGAVYGGEQIHLHKRVAIKVLRPAAERLPGVVERFEREAVAGAHVQHPNIAAAIDFGKLENGSYFLVSEYVEGKPLSEMLRAGPLQPARALHIARQMADALAAVHAKGILHRDVKPQNTLVGEGDRVKIIDFGFAKVDVASTTGQTRPPGATPLTELGTVFGTMAYLAPEAELGMGAVDARSNLYALGVTLYEMLCGRRPFSAPDHTSLFVKQRTEDPPPPRVRAPDVPIPPPVERVVMRLVQRNPADRYASAQETMAAIDEALRSLGGTPQTVVMAALPPNAAPSPAAYANAVPPPRASSPGLPPYSSRVPETRASNPGLPPYSSRVPETVVDAAAQGPRSARVPETVVETAGPAWMAAPPPAPQQAVQGARIPRAALWIGGLVLAGLLVVGLILALVLTRDSDDDAPGATRGRTAAPRGTTTRRWPKQRTPSR